YWDAHPGAFDVAHVARLRVRACDHADMLAAAIRAGREFFSVAEEEFAARRLVAMPRGSFEMVRRRELSSAHADAIFGTSAGEIAGPLECESGGGFDLVRVIRTGVAELGDQPTRDAVSDAVFQQ